MGVVHVKPRAVTQDEVHQHRSIFRRIGAALVNEGDLQTSIAPVVEERDDDDSDEEE